MVPVKNDQSICGGTVLTKSVGCEGTEAFECTHDFLNYARIAAVNSRFSAAGRRES